MRGTELTLRLERIIDIPRLNKNDLETTVG